MASESGAYEMEETEDLSLVLRQLPMCWDDRRLLKHEPFRNLFACRDQIELWTDVPNAHWADLVKNGVNEEFVKAFIRWCLIAFHTLNGEHNPQMLATFVEQSSYWEIFVEVFYMLHQAQNVLRSQKFLIQKKLQEEALKLLNKERKTLGFKDFLVLRPRIPRRLARRDCESTSYDPPPFMPREEAEKPVGNASYGILEELFTLHTKDIENACAYFMKTLPINVIGSENLMSGRRPIRRAAPSPQLLEDFSRQDAEAKMALPARSMNKKRKKCKGKVPTTRMISGPGKADGEALVDEGGAQLVERTAQTASDTSLMSTTGIGRGAFDAESIVVDNQAALISSSGAVLNPNPSTLSQRRGKTCSTKKRGPEMIETTIALSMTSGPESNKRRRELSDPRAKRDSTLLSSCQAKEFSADDAVAPGKRKKKVCRKGKFESIALEETSVSQRKRCSKLPMPNESGMTHGMQTVYAPSSLSDDTLVDGDGNKYIIDPKVLHDRLFHDSPSVSSEPAVIEDPIRSEKMVESLDKSRPQICLSKPRLPEWARPRVWAGSRQALCETTTWFRCYHGGVYFRDGKVHGYLLGGYSSQRDKFHHDGRLIISHGGGKSLGGSEGQRDHDASVRALLYNYRVGHPLVLLIDDKYAPFPFDLEKKMYVVLGLYWIVNAWAEKDVVEDDGKVETRTKYKFAFQYCEGQGSPWWLGKPTDVSKGVAHGLDGASNFPDIPGDRNEVPRTIETSANGRTLGTNPPRLQNASREKACVSDERNVDIAPGFSASTQRKSSHLNMRNDFLNFDLTKGLERLTLVSRLLCPIRTKYLSTLSTQRWDGGAQTADNFALEKSGKAGNVHNARRKFFPSKIQFPIRSLSEFWEQESDLKDYKVYKVYEGSGVTVSSQKWISSESGHSGIHHIFRLPEDRGCIHLIRGNVLVNGRANGLFRQYQVDALGKKFLRRITVCRSTFYLKMLSDSHPFAARGQMLTNYFSHNAGVPYKYAVTTNITDPFDQAPPSVNGALQLIRDRVSLVIKKEADFNEILTAAYMARQKMSYHTDDEKGLGPVVASLSLGSVAHMHFRHRRTATNRSIDKQLSIVLRHGDVLAMEGAPIQELYEHSVVPANFRIAATARCIDQGPGNTEMPLVPTTHEHVINYYP
ncbi:hypothetical protein ACEPAI_7886 [Sanghuangporus weigelae]